MRRAWRGAVPIGGDVSEAFASIGDELRMWTCKRYADRELATLAKIEIEKEHGVALRVTRVGLP